jgi:hypothetical protein
MSWKRALGLLAVVAVSFGWGFLSYRHQQFPYLLIRDTANKLGLVYKTAEEKPRTQRLDLVKSLPYAHATFDPRHEESGVVSSTDRTQAGYNFYNAWQDSNAYLTDMQGNVLHTWSHDFRGQDWHHVELLPGGDILVVLRGDGVAKLDKDSKLVWYYATPAHHGVFVRGTGEIFVITGEEALLPEVHPTLPSFFDKIAVLSSGGTLLEEFSLLETVQKSPYRYLLPSFAQDSFPKEITALDIMHTNHIEVFDGSLEHLSKLYKRGNMLISMRHMNAIAILDGDSREIVWLWGPTNVYAQHHPRLLENGNILLFDNGTSSSRVIEVEPATGRIAWKYENGEAFFSEWGGSVQRLPNGNTLVTNSNSGRAFEVTAEGKIVWEFANPKVYSNGDRANIWRLTRFQGNEPGFPVDLVSKR